MTSQRLAAFDAFRDAKRSERELHQAVDGEHRDELVASERRSSPRASRSIPEKLWTVSLILLTAMVGTLHRLLRPQCKGQ